MLVGLGSQFLRSEIRDVMAVDAEYSMESVRLLLSACEQGHLGKAETVLTQGVYVDAGDEDGTTALQVAAANGHEDVMGMLLMKGAALDLCNIHGWTPLLHAARHGHTSVVSHLIQKQADFNARTRLGASALVVAAEGGHLNTCKLLIETGVDTHGFGNSIGGSSCEHTPLMVAAQNGHDNLVRYFLDRGFDVNYRMPSTGVSALMLAARNGHMTTSQILIERGADANLTNVNEHTALEIAKMQGRREVRGYLDRKTLNKPKAGEHESHLKLLTKCAAQQSKLMILAPIFVSDIFLAENGTLQLMEK